MVLALAVHWGLDSIRLVSACSEDAFDDNDDCCDFRIYDTDEWDAEDLRVAFSAPMDHWRSAIVDRLPSFLRGNPRPWSRLVDDVAESSFEDGTTRAGTAGEGNIGGSCTSAKRSDSRWKKVSSVREAVDSARAHAANFSLKSHPSRLVNRTKGTAEESQDSTTNQLAHSTPKAGASGMFLAREVSGLSDVPEKLPVELPLFFWPTRGHSSSA